jgi:hypothetical protein
MPTPTQTTTTTSSGLKVKTHVKAGGIILDQEYVVYYIEDKDGWLW